jgi:alpha-tubulin suppressor-like RCC1 family protein
LQSYQILDPSTLAAAVSESEEKGFRYPTIAKWLDNVALRVMQLHRRHAACVDARGDVYQWGDGFFGSAAFQGVKKPIPTLKGKVFTSHYSFGDIH